MREIAVAGDVEAVLSFGVGVEYRDLFGVLMPSDPGRIVVDMAMTTDF